MSRQRVKEPRSLTATRPQPDPETLVIDWDVPIPMDDGIVLRADVFRPNDTGPHPVIMTHGPYAKGLSFQERHPTLWRELAEGHPGAVEGSSNRYANWETVDPEQWVPDGYVVIRVDSRGAAVAHAARGRRNAPGPERQAGREAHAPAIGGDARSGDQPRAEARRRTCWARER
jgi:predicted acyl esterase